MAIVEVDRPATPDGPGSAGAHGGGRGPTLGWVLGLGFAVWGLLIGLQPLQDNSFLTHLATGRLILSSGVPTTDPYSFTAHGSPFLVQSWLPSLVYALVERAAGTVGLSLLMGLTVGALGALAWRLTARAGSALARLVTMVPVAVVGSAMWSERPLLFGLLFLGLALLAADGELDPRWLLPVGWLWVNSHGSFPYGLLALGLLAAGRRLDGGRPGTELRALRWLALGTVAGAIGPLGPRILTSPLAVLHKKSSLDMILEWQPPRYDALWQYAFLASVLLGVVALTRRPSWRLALPYAVFLVLALTAMRNLSVFGLVLLPGISVALGGFGSISDRLRSAPVRLGAMALAALSVVSVLVATQRPGIDLGAYPNEALSWLDARGTIADPTRRLLAPDVIGNQLEYLLGPDARVFYDDRADMYPVDVAQDYAEMARARPGWSEVLDRRGVTTVLWERERPLALLLASSDAWTLSWSDDEWAVFDRR